MEMTVTNDTGYKAEVRTVEVSGGVEVRTAVYIIRNMLSPFVTIKKFTGDGAQAKADKYVTRLVAALLDEEEK